MPGRLEWFNLTLTVLLSLLKKYFDFRIDPENGKMLMSQKLTLKQIKEEGMTEHQQTLGEETVSTAKFDPSLQLANLHNLVAELKSLSGGTYLVSHDKKSGAFCRLYKPAQG